MPVTTTELLEYINKQLDEVDGWALADSLSELVERLNAGEPPPDQWRTGHRDFVERWATQPGTDRTAEIRLHSRGGCSVRLTPNERTHPMNVRIFAGRTPDEAYQQAAEYLQVSP